MRAFAAAFLFLGTLSVVQAESLMMKQWLRQDGLPQSSVQAIAQTPDGYLWLGTRGGLARFDGVNFKTYGLADGLEGLVITSLVNDGLGGLWIGTFGGGLSRWHDGEIKTLTVADGLADNIVLELAPSEAGGVWVGGKSGLQHYGASGFSNVDIPEGEVQCLAVESSGELWISVKGGGLFLLQDGELEPVSGPAGEAGMESASLLVDSGGALWAGIGNGKVLRRDDSGWTLFDESAGLPVSFINSLVEGQPGEIWAGSHEGGLYVLSGDRFERVTPISGELPGSIRAGFSSGDGLVWVGTEAGGLARLSRPNVWFHRVEAERSGRVHGFVQTGDGKFLVTVYGGGLFRGGVDSLEKWIDSELLNQRPYLLTGRRMSSGKICMAGIRTLVWIDAAATELEVHTIDRDITAVSEGEAGELWLGGRGGEFLRWNGGALEVVAEFSAPISGLVSDGGNGWWIGTQGGGLIHWRDGEESGRWTKEQGLPTNVLRTLYRDAEGTLWIGTGGGGLAWLEDGRVATANSRDGLANNFISQILEDDSGNLWLGSQAGIMRLPKQELRDLAAGEVAAVRPVVLDESDGMVVAECSGGFSPAGLVSDSGLMYFPTPEGLVEVDPQVVLSDRPPPRPRIESFSVGGQRPAGNVVPAGGRDIEVRYTAFDYRNPEGIRFRYRLQGAEAGRDWIEVGAERAARFSSLRPGDYKFELSAAGVGGNWSEDLGSAEFSVLPHYWQTDWFRFSMVALLLGIGACTAWLAARARVRAAQVREQIALGETEALQHKSEVERLTRLATLGELSATLAHELNQPLAAILSNAQAAQRFFARGDPDPDEIREILGDIVADDQRASKVIDRVRTILKKGQFKSETLDLNAVVTEGLGLVEKDFASRGIEVVTELEEKLLQVKGDRVQLQQVLINLALNAAAAMTETPQEERLLSVATRRYDDRRLGVSVGDRGHGIAPGSEEKIFEPYHTTREAGLGLGLSMSRSILLAHGGELWVEPNPGGGAIFHFAVPTVAASVLD